MAEYEVERTMPAGAEIVFDTVSDVERMDRWLPAQMRLEPAGPNLMEYHDDNAAPDSARRSGETGVFGVNPDQLRMEWGSRDTPDYSGWLQVFHDGAGASSVTLHLSFFDGQPEARVDTKAGRLLRHEMSQALERLAQEVTARLSSGE